MLENEVYNKINVIVLEISKEYDIDFNNKIPFQDYGSDEEETYMCSFSKYYNEIFKKLNYNFDIKTNEVSDGKYELIINNEYLLDIRAWDSIRDVLDNVETILELEKEKQQKNEEILSI